MSKLKGGSIVSVTVDGKTFDCVTDADEDKNLGRWDRPDYSKLKAKVELVKLSEDDAEFLSGHINSKGDQDDI